MDAREVKRVESEAWGKTSFAETERLSAKSGHIIGALILERSIQDFDIVDKNLINVGGGHGEEAELLLKNGAGAVTIVDIAEGQLKNACVRRQKHHLDNLECVRGDAEYLPFKDDSFDLGYIYMALHHFPNHARSITEVCRVSREVLFVDIMNPILTRVLTKIGFFREEWCGIAPNRLDGKSVENILTTQKLKPTVTYFFAVPTNTYNPLLIRCSISFFKLTNQLIARSKSAGLLCGNVAIIRGTQ
jgi:ubiquinone/menaquinone biosynthesis C-methylase UbiE